MEVPCELTVLSNMPVATETLDGSVKTVYFGESPNMSTYLVAVVVGMFDYIKDLTSDGMYKYCLACFVVPFVFCSYDYHQSRR